MSHFVKDDNLNIFRLRRFHLLIYSVTLSGANSTTASTNSSSNIMMAIIGSRSNAASGTLDATNFGQYDQLVQACLATGAKCIIDVHNYARFNGM